MTLIYSVVKATRPKQWLKNGLVVASPLMSGELFVPSTLLLTFLGFISFTVASASIYLLNDVLDVKLDREHPKKRFRPIASGALPVNIALFVMGCLIAVSIAIPIFATNLPFLLVISTYLFLQVGYCFWWKHVALIDIAIISSGFLLRAIGGAMITHIGISEWFLLVAAFGSFFIAAGKRYSEYVEVSQRAPGTLASTRKVLTDYTKSYLRTLVTVSISLIIAFYCLWAFEVSPGRGFLWSQISILPFTLAVLRYQQQIDKGEAQSPEDVLTSDRVFVTLAIMWLFSIFAAIYLEPQYWS